MRKRWLRSQSVAIKLDAPDAQPGLLVSKPQPAGEVQSREGTLPQESVPGHHQRQGTGSSAAGLGFPQGGSLRQLVQALVRNKVGAKAEPCGYPSTNAPGDFEGLLMGRDIAE